MQTKSKRLIAGMAVAGCAVLTIAGMQGRAQNRGRSAMPHYVWLEREAVIAQSPQVVASSDVDLAAWSPDGRRVLAFRTEKLEARPDAQALDEPNVETSVVLWNLATKRSIAVWKHRGLPLDADSSTASSLSWLPGTQTALLSLEWREIEPRSDTQGGQNPAPTLYNALLLVDTLRGTAREVALSSWLPYNISPTKPQIALHDFKEQTVRILDGSGAVGPALALPKEPTLSVEWMPDGNALLLRWFEKGTVTNVGEKPGEAVPAPAKMTTRYARMDAVSGAITRLDKRPAPIGDKGNVSAVYAGPLHIRQTSQVLQEGAARHHAYPLWLESDTKSEQARTLLCADGDNAQISPRGDAALYLSQGVACVTPLVRMPREAFTQTLRALAMRNGKYAALGLMMYCQDYDEAFPASASVISPYLKDDGILDGLNYTYGGGAIDNTKKPSETILGTYPGPGGVAVLYADGHVRWKDK